MLHSISAVRLKNFDIFRLKWKNADKTCRWLIKISKIEQLIKAPQVMPKQNMIKMKVFKSANENNVRLGGGFTCLRVLNNKKIKF